jgi:hypothetical protein
MHFFVPNTTVCTICNIAIERRDLALFVPNIDINRHPELAKFAGAYLHRACFESSEFRKSVSKAAFSSAYNIIENQNPSAILYSDRDLLAVKYATATTIMDYDLMFGFDIPHKDGAKPMESWIKFFQGDSEDLKVQESERYLVERTKLGIKLVEKGQETLVADLIVPYPRLNVWIEAITHVLEAQHFVRF